jgi:Cof subfamily protein (haloacid dehalogenase superfamily)
MSTPLFITDLDGTLLTPDVCVSQKSAQILSSLADKGVLFTCATARTPATVVPLLADVRSSLPAIVLTGAALYDRNAGRYLSVQFINADAVSAIYKAFTDEHLLPFIYTLPDDGRDLLQVYVPGTQLTPYQQKFVDERINLPLKHFNLNTLPPAAEAARHVLFFAMGDVDAIERAAAVLRNGVDCQVSCYRDTYDRSIGLLEILASGVSKANAVLQMKAHVGADTLIVYGDNLNDLPMMAVADIAVAVDNALPQVKAAATTTIGPNTADSVALHIASLISPDKIE